MAIRSSSGKMAFIKPRKQVYLNLKKALRFPGKIRQDKEAFNAMMQAATNPEYKEIAKKMESLIQSAVFNTSPKNTVDWMSENKHSNLPVKKRNSSKYYKKKNKKN